MSKVKSPIRLPKMKLPGRHINQLITVLLVAALLVLLAYTFHLLMVQSQKKEGYEDKPIYYLVYIYSASCPHCKTFTPVFDACASEMGSEDVKFVKYEASQDSAKQYLDMVHGFPTVLLFENDTYKADLIGNQDKAKLVEFVGKHTNGA